MGSVDTCASLEWHQTEDGVYRRGLDSVERFYDFIAKVGVGRPDKTNWSVSMGIKVRTTRPDHFAGDIREAWIVLRHKLPTLAAFIQDGAWMYNTIEREGLETWLEETFHVHENVNRPSRSLFPLEDLMPSKSPRVVLHVFPSTQEIAIHGPHTHLDATGMTLFFDQLLTLLVNPSTKGPAFPEQGNEASNLAPPLAITARIPAPTADQIETFNSSMQAFLAAQPGIKLHADNTKERASTSHLLRLTFTAHETAQIATTAKAHGVTVTAALQAAVSRAAQIHSRGQAHQQAIMALYDARRYLDDVEPNTSQLAVSPHVFAMPAVYPVPTDASFLATAHAARAEFLRFATDDVVRATSPLWAEQTIALLSQPLPAGAPVPADLNFSSVGVVDRVLRSTYTSAQPDETSGPADVEVVDMWIGLDMLHPTCLVEAWTFRGRLRVELIYNEAYHGREDMAYLCGLVHEQLAQGLKLDLKFDLQGQGEEEWFVGKE